MTRRTRSDARWGSGRRDSRKLKPYGMLRSCMALPMLAKNQATRNTTRMPDTICAVHWMMRACRQTGMPW